MSSENLDNPDETDVIYAIRYASRAVQDIENEHNRLSLLIGDALADTWEEGLFTAIARLSRMPTIHAVISEQKLFPTMRIHELLYRRSSSSVQYRVLFIVRKTDMDAPLVRILHVRHGARRPITRIEATKIKAEDF